MQRENTNNMQDHELDMVAELGKGRIINKEKQKAQNFEAGGLAEETEHEAASDDGNTDPEEGDDVFQYRGRLRRRAARKTRHNIRKEK